MLILNRIRGMYSWASWPIGITYGFIIYLIFGNPYVGLLFAAGYIFGESMGWGEWIGRISNPSQSLKMNDIEGRKNGIYWLASKLADRGTVLYSYIALTLRGVWWWLPALLPLYLYVGIAPVLLAVTTLAIAFPLSVVVAKECDFHIDFIDVHATWARAEVIYGGVMDIVIVLLIVTGLYI